MGCARWAFGCGLWTPGRAQWLLAARCVQPEEKLRIGQFVFTRDAKAAMAGRLLMRKLIAENLGIPWDEIVLQRTAKGKPFLANDVGSNFPTFSFNVSHQGNYAVLAAELGFQVGIDVMKTDYPGSGSVEEFFRIMNRQFTEYEWKSIKSMDSEWAQLDAFYRHWALKESYIKALGIGVGFNLQRIEFHASPLKMEVGKVYKETTMQLDGEEEETWIFEETMLDDRHHVAVAVGEPGVPGHYSSLMPGRAVDHMQTHFTILNFDDLVASAVPMYPEDPAYWESFISKPETPSRQGEQMALQETPVALMFCNSGTETQHYMAWRKAPQHSHDILTTSPIPTQEPMCPKEDSVPDQHLLCLECIAVPKVGYLITLFSLYCVVSLSTSKYNIILFRWLTT